MKWKQYRNKAKTKDKLQTKRKWNENIIETKQKKYRKKSKTKENDRQNENEMRTI